MDNRNITHKLIDIGKQIIAESDIDQVLGLSIDHAIQASGAERGMIILFDEMGKALFETARNLEQEDIKQPQFEVSQTIINKVRTEKKSIWLRNAIENKELIDSLSAFRLKILSVICLPLVHQKELFGVIYLDNRSVKGVFEADTCSFMKTFSDFISLAAYHALERKKLTNRVDTLESELRNKYHFDAIVGHDPKIVKILKLVAQIADADATVLIQSESGTGKELLARALHFNSKRKDHAFVPINCGALPDNLLESELFGHVKGAFTGAIKDKSGWFERADGGTILLDEVSLMPPALQVKLLRVLQTGEFTPVGSTEIRHCDVRIVAATNQDLKKLVQEDRFREDVFFRLNVINLELPPLRDRKGDIPLLAQHFLEMYNGKSNKNPKSLSIESENLLLAYDYPGNIRELENLIQRAVTLAESSIIQPHHFPFSISENSERTKSSKIIYNITKAKRLAADNAEKEIAINCLKSTNGHISKAAKKAGILVGNFHRIIKKHSIHPSDFKKRG